MTALILDGIKQDKAPTDWRKDYHLRKLAQKHLMRVKGDAVVYAYAVATAVSEVASSEPRDFAEACIIMGAVCDRWLTVNFKPAGKVDAQTIVATTVLPKIPDQKKKRWKLK